MPCGGGAYATAQLTPGEVWPSPDRGRRCAAPQRSPGWAEGVSAAPRFQRVHLGTEILQREQAFRVPVLVLTAGVAVLAFRERRRRERA